MILCDTHASVWWLTGDARLTRRAAAALAGGDRAYFSHASLWELAIKVTKFGAQRVPDLAEAHARLKAHEAPPPFAELAISRADCIASGELPLHHGDPFDRMLAAQALQRKLPILSADKVFDVYGVKRIW